MIIIFVEFIDQLIDHPINCASFTVYWISGNSSGREFYFGVIPNGFASNIMISVASTSPGTLSLKIPFLKISRNHRVIKGKTSIPVSSAIVKSGTFVDNRGIYISSDVDISVVVTNGITVTSDSYLALPVSSLGLHYAIASYTPFSTFSSEIMVVGVSNDTKVSIFKAGSTNITNVTINRFIVYQMADPNDLTNTIVLADKPVSVIAGSSCSYVPSNIGSCDMLMEQLAPVSTWTRSVIVPPLLPKPGFNLRILATENGANVTVATDTKSVSETVAQNAFKEFTFGKKPVVVTSDSPVSIVQYGHGQNNDRINGDPFLMVVPGINQYMNEYTFVIPAPKPRSKFTHHIAIIAPSSKISELRLDGLAF